MITDTIAFDRTAAQQLHDRLTEGVFYDDYDGDWALIGALRAALQSQAARCPYCDDTGDVHGVDGEWRGACTCPAGKAQAAPAEPTPVAWRWVYAGGGRSPIYDGEGPDAEYVKTANERGVRIVYYTETKAPT